jgi:hypothetical protein
VNSPLTSDERNAEKAGPVTLLFPKSATATSSTNVSLLFDYTP